MSNAGSSEELREAVRRLEDEVAALRRSRRRLALAAHADRRTIERALHDGVQQHLVALAVDLQRLGSLIDQDADAAKALLAQMRVNTREAVDDAMRLAILAYPPIIDGHGLAAALRSAANEAGVPAIVEVPGSADYPPEVTVALYWTWVEAISLAARGSEPKISVHLADGGLAFGIMISGQLAAARIDGLRDRIEGLDGRLSLDDRQDSGAHLQGWLPLPR